MTVDLTPHRASNPVPPYLTVIPTRSASREKLHAARGLALSAITYQVEAYSSQAGARVAAALYAWDGDGWKLLWSCQRGDDVTGRPWKAAAIQWEATR